MQNLTNDWHVWKHLFDTIQNFKFFFLMFIIIIYCLPLFNKQPLPNLGEYERERVSG